MAAPNLSFSASGSVISGMPGFDKITVSFQAESAYLEFECRATKVGEPWGRGKGVLIAAFAQTPAETARTFEIYDDYLVNGDGQYRISLFAKGEDGSWNDNCGFIPAGASGLVTADGDLFLTMR